MEEGLFQRFVGKWGTRVRGGLTTSGGPNVWDRPVHIYIRGVEAFSFGKLKEILRLQLKTSLLKFSPLYGVVNTPV